MSLFLLVCCAYEQEGQVWELPEAAVLRAVGAVRAEKDSFGTVRRLQVGDDRSLGAAEYAQDVREPHAAARPVMFHRMVTRLGDRLVI